MPLFDKQVEKEVKSILREVNIKLYLERSDEQVNTVLECINNMPEIEKEIMTRKFINVEGPYTTHQSLYKSMGLYDSKYAIHRSSAFKKLATALGLLEEVM